MLLIKRICEFHRKPVFEVESWPVSELEHWAIFFSIDDNNDKPIIVQKTSENISESESKHSFRELMG